MSYLPPPPVPGAGTYGVGPYATTGWVVGPLRSLRGLWMALLALFALVAVTDIVAAGAFFHRAGLIEDLGNGSFVSFDDGTAADDAVTSAIGFHVLLVLGIAVVFIIWQYRHAKNAQALGERGGLGPGWAIGGWFIPVGNLVLPGVQLHQSSRLSDPLAAAQPGGRGRGAGIVVVWMVALGLAVLLAVGSGAVRPTDDEGNVVINGAEDFDSAASGDRTAGMSMIVFVAAAIVGAVMVRSLSTKQAVAYQARLTTPTAPVPPNQWADPVWSQPAPPVAPPAPAQWGTPPAPPPAPGASPPLPDWGSPPP